MRGDHGVVIDIGQLAVVDAFKVVESQWVLRCWNIPTSGMLHATRHRVQLWLDSSLARSA